MLNKLTVRSRLFLVLTLSLVALVIMGILGTYNIRSLRQENENLVQGMALVKRLYVIKQSLTDQLLFQERIIANGNLKQSAQVEHLKKTGAIINENWTSYSSVEPMFEDDLLMKQHSMKADTQQLIKNLEASLVKIENDLQERPIDIQQLNQLINKELFPKYSSIVDNIDQLISLHAEDTSRDYSTYIRLFDTVEYLTYLCLIASMILLILITLLIIRSIVNPLTYAVKNLEFIANGNVSNEIEVTSGGELGSLLESMQFMSNQLREMIQEMQQEVTVLTSSSKEIMASQSQLAAAATETASAVTETSTTIEELKQTAHVSADKAKDVLAYAEETLQTVTASGTAVGETIEDMNQIRDRMQVISDSILKLSEKGLAIAGFMDSVSEIAEQSNLLAVNAALEAAKAGEQGRSFSIVAQQIRILAEQSKGATIQVRSLLSEIQNATNAAVLATDQGSKAVSKGVDQSTQASRAMMDLAQKMEKFTQAASQIVHSNQQQLIGTEQITVAMSNINDATTQHVEQLRQIETAIESLNRVSTTLLELISQYKTKDLKKENIKQTSLRRTRQLVEA